MGNDRPVQGGFENNNNNVKENVDNNKQKQLLLLTKYDDQFKSAFLSSLRLSFDRTKHYKLAKNTTKVMVLVFISGGCLMSQLCGGSQGQSLNWSWGPFCG